MNVRMWLNPATQRNLATLRGDGVAVVGPNEGSMACGEFGPVGRMAEVPRDHRRHRAGRLMADPAVGRPARRSATSW
jgi:phosphopantothenoylcysteine decarboxylase/phosphopantothenate--cysteine ligase